MDENEGFGLGDRDRDLSLSRRPPKKDLLDGDVMVGDTEAIEDRGLMVEDGGWRIGEWRKGEMCLSFVLAKARELHLCLGRASLVGSWVTQNRWHCGTGHGERGFFFKDEVSSISRFLLGFASSINLVFFLVALAT